jgi:hypothetical protein
VGVVMLRHKKCRLNVFQLEHASGPQEFKNEPKIALETGEEGLEIINKIKSFLNPKGRLIAEVGISAGKRLKKTYPKDIFNWLKYRKPSEKKSIWDILDKLEIFNIFPIHCAFICGVKDLS